MTLIGGVEISDNANTLMLTSLFALWALGVTGTAVCGGGGACLGIAVMGFAFEYALVYALELLLFICIDFRTNPAIRFRVGERPKRGVDGLFDELLDEGVCGCLRRKSVRTAEAESKIGSDTRRACLRRREPIRQKHAMDRMIPATMPGKKPAKTAPAGNEEHFATGVVTVEFVASTAGTVV